MFLPSRLAPFFSSRPQQRYTYSIRPPMPITNRTEQKRQPHSDFDSCPLKKPCAATMLLPDARHGNAAKTVRLSPELQSSTKQSCPFARQIPPVCFPHGTAVRVCASIFAFSYSYGSTVISRFPTNRSHRLFSAKKVLSDSPYRRRSTS